MNEADTRAELIDKQLEAVGWSTGDDVQAAQALQAVKELL